MTDTLSVDRPAHARPYIVGANHRTADGRLREALFVEEARLDEAYAAIGAAGLVPAALLSTCDRVELHGMAADPEAAAARAEAFLADRAGVPPHRLDGAVYRLHDADAVGHLYRVASALDSHMVGEAQILGQLKAAAARANAAGTMSAELDRLYQSAFQLAKRVRSQTRIGEGAVSVAAAAVRVAGDLHGDLANRRGLLIGLGDVADVMLEQFERAGLTRFDMTGPSRRTERVAGRAGRNFVPFDRLAEALGESDVVVTAGGLGRYLVTPEVLEAALDRRRRRPVLLLDCGVPRDVEPACDRIEEAFLYSLADIERLAERGQLDRRAEAEEAGRMAEAAVIEWRRHQAEQEGIPALVALREHFETARADVLSRHPRADAGEATRLLMNRLLHRPSEALRAIAGEGGAADLRDMVTVNRVLARLFGVGGGAENDGTADQAERDDQEVKDRE